MARIDYDAIAHLYDEPLRDHGVDEQLLAFLGCRAPSLTREIRVIDIGCGTGKQLASDRAHLPDARLIGLDRSEPMLQIAHRRCPSVTWVRADGAALPLATCSVDYATSQYSYQHIGATRALLHEVFRVLRAGGRFVMTNIDPWAMPGWLVYRYFPEAWRQDTQDFIATDRFVALMEDAGFLQVDVSRTDLSRDEPLADFLDYASARYRASQLTAIGDAAYARGIERLREVISHAGVAPIAERSQFVRVTIVGEKAWE